MNRKTLYKKMEAKFLKGKEEHFNDLKDMSDKRLLMEALDECIDMIFYLNQLLNKIK